MSLTTKAFWQDWLDFADVRNAVVHDWDRWTKKPKVKAAVHRILPESEFVSADDIYEYALRAVRPRIKELLEVCDDFKELYAGSPTGEK